MCSWLWASLDLTQTDGSIVEGTAEYDADRASTVCVCGTAKQRVNSRTVAVLARTARHRHAPPCDGEMESGRGDINPARFDGIAVSGVCRGKIAGTFENLGQHAANAVRQVQRNENGGWKVRLNVLHDTLQRAHPAGRGAYHHDIEVRHNSRAARSGTGRALTIRVLV